MWFGKESSKVAHEFYVSVTDLYVDVEEGRLEGVVKTFPDDWERAMNALLAEKVVRYPKLTTEEKDELHRAYLTKTLLVEFEGKDLELNYDAIVEGPNEVLLLFTAELPKRARKAGNWTIDHLFFTDIFPAQENIVILHRGSEKRTNSCRKGNSYHLEIDL